MVLETISSPRDIKHVTDAELSTLAAEIRQAILAKVSARGGHLGSNLGIVEATIALHKTFDSPHDKFIFDVSHQTYAHKILTGRKEAFVAREHYGDVSGFMSPDESAHDPFTIGHTSTSISLAAGMALGRDAAGENYNVVAIIGDGALSGGEALEGLNFAATLTTPLVILLNDNNQSIAPNVGSLYANLAELRKTRGRAQSNFFTLLGFDYLFVEDGHNIASLCAALEQAKAASRPVVVHIVTEKGHGFLPATKRQELFHSVKPFSLEDAEHCPYAVDEAGALFSRVAIEQHKVDPRFFVITSATPLPLGFTPDARAQMGTHFIDVGIAEQTAVATAAGLTKAGAHAVYGVQSTFLQRAYDQVAQELALDSIPATIVTFTASVYCTHDKTHQGRLDISLLANIPNVVYLAPATVEQFESAFSWAVSQSERPVGIKMPGVLRRAGEPFEWNWDALNTYQVVQRGTRVAILGLGTFCELARETAAHLAEKHQLVPTVINPLYASGVDTELLDELGNDTELFVTLEDGIVEGGWGQKVASYLASKGKRCVVKGLSKEYRPRYQVEEELLREGLTPEQVARKIVEAL